MSDIVPTYMMPLKAVLDKDDWLICPLCSEGDQHMGQTQEILAHDPGPAEGKDLILPFEGECGHEWDIVIHYSKGNHLIYVRTYEKPDGYAS